MKKSFNMDLKKIGIVLIFIGIVLTVVFIDNQQIFVPALTVTVLGFFVTIVGFLSDVRKRKIINDRLDSDIENILQPLITKYSNLNKEYRANFEGSEYADKRMQLNRDLERENYLILKAEKSKRLSLNSVRNRIKCCEFFFKIFFNVHLMTTRF